MKDMAITKINKELASYKGGQAENIMKNDVARVLCDFCGQDQEFAQAVIQGGSFAACMKAVARNERSGISDLEAYKRAVQFYFPGAGIQFTMKINLCDSVEPDELSAPAPISAAPAQPEVKTAILLDFSEFL